MRFFFLVLFILNDPAYANLASTGLLSESQMYSITESTGLSLVTSYAENLYPLGGYTGLRFSASYRMISNAQLRGFSMETSQIPDLGFTELGLSKGLYSNIDFFASFTPLSGGSRLSSFSGGIRWTFLELPSKPIHFIVAISGRSTNWLNQATF